MTGRMLPQVVSGTAGWTSRSRGRAGLWERPRVQSGHVGMEVAFPYPRLSRSEADSGLEHVRRESAILLRRREAGTEHQAGEGQVGRRGSP